MPDKGRESVKVMARRGRQQFGLFSFFVDILVSRNTALERREMEVTMLTHPHHCQSHSKGATLTLDEPLFANVLFQQLYLPRQRTMTTWVMLRCGHWKETCGYLQPSLGFPTCPFPINGSFEASGLRRHKSPSTPFSPSPSQKKTAKTTTPDTKPPSKYAQQHPRTITSLYSLVVRASITQVAEKHPSLLFLPLGKKKKKKRRLNED